MQDYIISAQMRDESTAPYLHEGMPVEVTWQQDVPIAMIALEGGPGSNAHQD